MGRINALRLVVLAATVLCGLVSAGSAAAADTSSFGCRASAARVGLGSSTVLEPLVANKNGSPCATASDGLNTVSIPSAMSTALTAGPAAVYTFSSSSQPTTTGPVAPGASALASVDGVTIPTSSGSIVIAGPIAAQASYACVNGSLQSSSSSTLTALYINGNKVTLAPDQGETISLGGGSYVAANEKLQTADSLTERILDVHLQGIGDVVVGEAGVTKTGDPCAGTSSSTPPAVNACPTGSSYDAAKQVCEIVLPGGQVIVVSRPFEGPTGGSVMAVSVARHLYKSPCLKGEGPLYAIIGTNKPDRINGTHRSERILGLGGHDRIAGQGGNDCIDAGSGSDRVWGGNGNVRVWGGTGNDRIWTGNGNNYLNGGPGNDLLFTGAGNDRVYAGQGNDRIAVGRGNDRIYGGSGRKNITAGDGNDWIWGGSGTARIYVGNGKDHIFGGRHGGRIYAPGLKMWVSCGSPRALAFVTKYDAPWARRHGCQRVRLIHPHKL